MKYAQADVEISEFIESRDDGCKLTSAFASRMRFVVTTVSVLSEKCVFKCSFELSSSLFSTSDVFFLICSPEGSTYGGPQQPPDQLR